MANNNKRKLAEDALSGGGKILGKQGVGAQSQMDSLIAMADLGNLINEYGKTYTMGESGFPSWNQTYTSPGGREQQQALLIASLLDQLDSGGTHKSRGKILGKQGGGAGTLRMAQDYAQNRLHQDWNEINNALGGQVPFVTANSTPTEAYSVIEQLLKNQGIYK